MRKMKKIFAAFMLFSVMFQSGCKNDHSEPVAESDNNEIIVTTKASYVPQLKCNYYDDESFKKHIELSESYKTDGKIETGVIPHHLLAGHMIASFLKTAAEKGGDVETIILVAPMHFPEDDELVTTSLNWSTLYGTMENDDIISTAFQEKLSARKNNDMLELDHSISSLIPYIKYYFNDAKISCLLVSPRKEPDIPEKIANLISEFQKEKEILTIFSVDFSHYLEPVETEKHDVITREMVLSHNISEITKMNDDNMDSPKCIETFIRLNELLGVKTAEYDHSNSMNISKLPYTHFSYSEGITSYFIFSGEKK